MRTGVFVGSFDPFTVGHHSVVRRAMPLFDRIVIGVGVNAGKACIHTAAERVAAIRELYSGYVPGDGRLCRIEVKQYDGLTADFARGEGAEYIIKGVRSVCDFEYERAQADVNRSLSGVETLLLFAEPQYASVCSSVVRELMRLGADVSRLVAVTYKDK